MSKAMKECPRCKGTGSLNVKMGRPNKAINMEVIELVEENTKLETELAELRERCEAYEKVLDECFKAMHLDYYGNPVVIADFESEVALIKEVKAKYKGDKK